jgi:F-type H+-transporting ATPase subunit delta
VTALDARPDAVARTYALSLFDLAHARGGRETAEQILSELEGIVDIARRDPRFREFLASRVIPVAARAASLRTIFEGRVHDLTLRFILLLNARHRLGSLPQIAAAIDEIAQERFGRVEVDVFSASPLAVDEIARIRARLAGALAREPVLHVYVEPGMIGGLKIRVGDRLIDGSIAARLRAMRGLLAERGPAEARARAARIIVDNGAEG